jgi:hypothetical protein
MANRDEERSLARAVVGGAEYVVGGWAAYEIDRRRERAAALAEQGAIVAGNPPRARYPPGRKYIHAHDAVHSVMSRARRTGAYDADLGETALVAAAKHLAAELAALEDRICEPDEDGVWEVALGHVLVVPPLTSADLAEFAADPAAQVDPAALKALADDAARVAAYGVTAQALADTPEPSRPALPPLPADTVPLGDDAAVLRLEGAVEPYVSAVEELQAEAATRFETAARAVTKMARARAIVH